jgi:hypothetical protein
MSHIALEIQKCLFPNTALTNWLCSGKAANVMCLRTEFLKNGPDDMYDSKVLAGK